MNLLVKICEASCRVRVNFWRLLALGEWRMSRRLGEVRCMVLVGRREEEEHLRCEVLARNEPWSTAATAEASAMVSTVMMVTSVKSTRLEGRVRDVR